MKSIIFLLTTINLTIFSGMQITDIDHTWLFLFIPSGLLSLWMIGCMFTSIDRHMDNLSTAHAAIKRIAAAEDALAAVKELAQDGKHGLPDSLLALQQDNNPVTTYMAQVRNAINDVACEKDRQAEAEAAIASRAAGPFGFVVMMFGSKIA